MAAQELTLKPVASSSAGKRPTPTTAQLTPWQFEYMPAPDGKDANLLIMFHGLGDTKAAFAGLGKQLNLPSTAVLSLQAPNPVPLMETPSWSWYNTFDPLFNPLPNPDPSPTLAPLRSLLSALLSLGWTPDRIHLFGWGQGGTMALELSFSLARDPLDGAKRLASVVSVCGPLQSFPTSAVGAQTPVLWFTRSDARAAVGQKQETAQNRAFKSVTTVRGAVGGEGMPRGGDEWIGIMRFWGQVLARGDEGWKGDGEVYEVVNK